MSKNEYVTIYTMGDSSPTAVLDGDIPYGVGRQGEHIAQGHLVKTWTSYADGEMVAQCDVCGERVLLENPILVSTDRVAALLQTAKSCPSGLAGSIYGRVKELEQTADEWEKAARHVRSQVKIIRSLLHDPSVDGTED